MRQATYEVSLAIAGTEHFEEHPLGNSMIVTNFRGQGSRHQQMEDYFAHHEAITYSMVLVRSERLRQLQFQRLPRAHTNGATFDAQVLERPHGDS